MSQSRAKREYVRGAQLDSNQMVERRKAEELLQKEHEYRMGKPEDTSDYTEEDMAMKRKAEAIKAGEK